MRHSIEECQLVSNAQTCDGKMSKRLRKSCHLSNEATTKLADLSNALVRNSGSTSSEAGNPIAEYFVFIHIKHIMTNFCTKNAILC